MANNIEIEALRKNEISANKQMVNVNIFTAIILIIVFLLYAFKVFPVLEYAYDGPLYNSISLFPIILYVSAIVSSITPSKSIYNCFIF